MKTVFLSIPYTHPDPTVIQNRLQVLGKYALKMVDSGRPFLSPINVGQSILDYSECTDGSFQKWSKLCKSYLDMADRLDVICADGWTESEGVKIEIEYWLSKQSEHTYNISFINPVTLNVFDLCGECCHKKGGPCIMHIMDCCSFCYEQVINEDGTLDLDKINDIVTRNSSHE